MLGKVVGSLVLQIAIRCANLFLESGVEHLAGLFHNQNRAILNGLQCLLADGET